MDIQHNALIVVFFIVTLLGGFAALFFCIAPMRIEQKNRGVIGYFVVFFLCLVLGCIVYILRSPFTDQGSTLINGALFITGAFALRHGFMLRKTPNTRHLLSSKLYWLCLMLMVVVNVYILHEVYKSFWLRIAFMNWMSAAITLSFIPLISINEKWTHGETLVKYAALFIALIFFTVPAVYLTTQNIMLYVLCTIIIEVLIIHIWLGCLCALMMSDAIQTHYENSINDTLTGIYNRRFFMQHIEQCKREDMQNNALVICDLDDFKCINDTFGHKNGDLAIIAFACLLRDNVNKQDVVARIGGEEFALCLKNVTLNDAKNIAERLKELTQATVLKTQDGKPIKLSASFGVCAFGRGISIDDVLHKADSAMYDAKKNGKGQVCLCK